MESGLSVEKNWVFFAIAGMYYFRTLEGIAFSYILSSSVAFYSSSSATPAL